MYKQLNSPKLVVNNSSGKNKRLYCINFDYLRKLGFEKNDVLSGPTEWVYRYYRRVKDCCGIEIVFLEEFSILSVKEFWLDRSDESTYVSNSIVGKFRICSDEDLDFIFSKSIKLNYIFNVEGKRV